MPLSIAINLKTGTLGPLLYLGAEPLAPQDNSGAWRRKRKATAADENVPGRCFRSDETKPRYRAASDSDGCIDCDHRQRQLFDQH